MENKLCPWCMTEFTEENKGVYCPSCGIKHHRSCFESKGCANPDCGAVTKATPKIKSAEELRQEYEARKKAEEREQKERRAKERYEADLEAIMNDKPLPSDGAVEIEIKEPKRTVSQIVIGIIGIVLSSLFFIVFTDYDNSGFAGMYAMFSVVLFVSILSKRRIPRLVLSIASLSLIGLVAFIALCIALAGEVHCDGLIGGLGLVFLNIYHLCNVVKDK